MQYKNQMKYINCAENIRLTGGSTIYEGRVEIFIQGQWGTVCGDGISVNEAETLCWSLGFGPFQATSNYTMESTTFQLVISHLMCSDYYDHFMKCTFNQSSPLCSSQSSLGLKCYCKHILCKYVAIQSCISIHTIVILYS